MTIYFDFFDRRRRAIITWPTKDEPILVRLYDKELLHEFPEDLYFELDESNRVDFTPEDVANKRLTELQKVLARRLQEFANQR